MAATASSTNVLAQNRTPSGQSSGRKSKHRSARRRSVSSPFASLFATLASFSSSNSSATPPIRASPSISRTSSSLPSTSSGLSPKTKARPSTSRNESTLSKAMPPASRGASKALVRRATTPAKQVASSKALQKTSTPAKANRPDVFSFQDGESRAPSPRPRNTSALTKVAKQPRQSIDERVYSSPIPVRPVIVPSVDSSDEDSYSDSGLTTSETPSPPDTPSPNERRASNAFHASGPQDAVGRSIHPEDFYAQKRNHQLQRVEVPPEAPTAPPRLHQIQSGQSNHTLRTSSFDYLSSPTLAGPAQYNSYPQAYHGQHATSPNASNPYPTPPLEPSQSQNRRIYARSQSSQSHPHNLHIASNRKSTMTQSSDPVSKSTPNDDYCPRQYAQLTQQMIHRCECIINALEEDLALVDQNEVCHDGWHRDQLVMKLSNAIIMHHRLLDTWSKVSHLPRLANLPSTPPTAHKLDLIRTSIRRNLDSYKSRPGLDVDSQIAHIVNDLVQIGESAAGSSSANGAGSGSLFVASDQQSLTYLFGAVLILLILQDGMSVRTVVVGGLVVGIWRCVQV